MSYLRLADLAPRPAPGLIPPRRRGRSGLGQLPTTPADTTPATTTTNPSTGIDPTTAMVTGIIGSVLTAGAKIGVGLIDADVAKQRIKAEQRAQQQQFYQQQQLLQQQLQAAAMQPPAQPVGGFGGGQGGGVDMNTVVLVGGGLAAVAVLAMILKD